MKELTPAQKALNKYRTAMTEVVLAKQYETAARLACDKADADFKLALAKVSHAQDVADRVRQELEELLAPAESTEGQCDPRGDHRG